MERKVWNEYQSNYSKSHYKSIGALLDAALVDKFKKKLKEDNISVADFMRKAIENYLKG